MVTINNRHCNKKTRDSKQKARHEATLAETFQQVNAMISEYFDLPFLSPYPKRVSQTTEALPME
jgi:hypothetical protein